MVKPITQTTLVICTAGHTWALCHVMLEEGPCCRCSGRLETLRCKFKCDTESRTPSMMCTAAVVFHVRRASEISDTGVADGYIGQGLFLSASL